MFGGLAFMVNIHMAVGIIRDELMLRFGTDGYDAALARGAEPMRVGGPTHDERPSPTAALARR
jgi:hypothetical protein